MCRLFHTLQFRKVKARRRERTELKKLAQNATRFSAAFFAPKAKLKAKL